MNKRQILHSLLPALTLGFSFHAHAVIVDGTFKGTVINAWDNGDNNNPFFNDFFSADILGKSFTGSFWYDTELAPANTGTTGQWRASTTNNWLGITFYVDGKILDLSQTPQGFTPINTWEALNVADEGSSTGLHDFTQEYFGLRDEVGAANGNLTSWQGGGISFLSAIIPSLSGNGLIQNFTWHDTGESYDNWDDIPGLAVYNIDSRLDDKQTQAGIAARLSEITVSTRTEVPEPSSLALFSMALFALIMRKRKFFRQ